mmetsp:Transcript_51920/g.110967  ORF Transcript_51920/g.110967 Transcript_51920/m.110967 type:complete len:201 (-) Transcript_51920:2155-2757(-)
MQGAIARLAIILVRGENVAIPCVLATTASLTALLPLAPLRHLAILGLLHLRTLLATVGRMLPRRRVARPDVFQGLGVASSPTVLRKLDDLSVALAHPIALATARRPLTPLRELAVPRGLAGLSVRAEHEVVHWTCGGIPAIVGMPGDLSAPRAVASAARHAAIAPRTPCRPLAIDAMLTRLCGTRDDLGPVLRFARSSTV